MYHPSPCLHTHNIHYICERGSVPRCLYRSANFTSSLFTLKTTDENLTVCTTDSFVPTQSNRAREESIPLGFCTYPMPTSLPDDFWQGTHMPGTPRDSNTGCFPKVGDFNIVNTSSPSYAVQSSCQATRRVCSGVLKPTTIIQSIPPFGRETSSLHRF